MTDSNNLTDETLAGGAQLTSADGGAAVADTLSLAELNQFLGKDFKDKASALKSLKDTQSYVGKKVEATATPAPTQPDPALAAKVKSLEEQVFYANHPELRVHEAIIKAMGSNPAEVVETEAFKTYFEKAKVADEVQKTKSVVASNGRIGSSSTYMQTAVTAANAGQDDVMLNALAQGIIEEFGLNA